MIFVNSEIILTFFYTRNTYCISPFGLWRGQWQGRRGRTCPVRKSLARKLNGWGWEGGNILCVGVCMYVCTYIYIYIKLKVKWSHYRPGVAQRVGGGIILLFHDRGIRRCWVVSSTPLLHFTPGYPFYRRLGGPQGRSGRAENLVPTGIRSRTVQFVVSRYTDWATRPPPTHTHIYMYIYRMFQEE